MIDCTGIYQASVYLLLCRYFTRVKPGRTDGSVVAMLVYMVLQLLPQCMCMCMSSSRPYRQAQQTDDGSDRISTPCLARVDLDHPCSNHGHGRRTAEHQACHPDPTTTSPLHTSAPTVSHSWQFGEEGSPILSLKNAVPCK